MRKNRKDFKKAEVPLKDERGHVVDFHALREDLGAFKEHCGHSGWGN